MDPEFATVGGMGPFCPFCECITHPDKKRMLPGRPPMFLFRFAYMKKPPLEILENLKNRCCDLATRRWFNGHLTS
jgi:hypothetical protein